MLIEHRERQLLAQRGDGAFHRAPRREQGQRAPSGGEDERFELRVHRGLVADKADILEQEHRAGEPQALGEVEDATFVAGHDVSRLEWVRVELVVGQEIEGNLDGPRQPGSTPTMRPNPRRRG